MSEAASSTRYIRYVIVLICVVQMFNYMDRMALAALLPLIKADLQLSDGQLGLLVGLAFSLFYAVCGIPIARWADRGVRRDIIALAVTIWSLMTALSGAAQNFWHLLAARVGVGAGEAGSVAPGASVLCDYVPLQRRSLALAFLAFGSAAGTLVGMAVAGWLGETIGWRWTFVALGAPGLALALLVHRTLREPKRGALESAPAGDRPTFVATLKLLWRCRTYRRIVLFLIANGFAQYGLYQWWPTFYTRNFDLSPAAAGLYLGFAIGGCGGVGVLIGGVVSARLADKGVGLPLRLAAVMNSLALPTVFASLFVPSVMVSLLLVSIATLLWAASNGPVLAAQYSVVASSVRATAGSIAVFLTSVIGFGVGPLIVGLTSDALAGSLGEDSLRYALIVPIIAFAGTVVALLAASRSLPEDLRAVGALAAGAFSMNDHVASALAARPRGTHA